MYLELTILGASSAIPLSHRFPTSQFLTIANRHFLIDCGEGTQVRLRQNNIGFGRINHIFISHLHGDHFFGLAPLLSTFNLLDRKKNLHIYAPKGLKEIINQQMKVQHSWLKYALIFHDLDLQNEAVVYEDDKIFVKSFPLKHSISCCGFLFQEKKRPRNMRRAALDKYKIPVTEIRRIKEGMDWTDENGNIIPNEELTLPPAKPLSYAYCTDTGPVEDLDKYLHQPDILYHEATFMEQHRERAAKTLHSTARQAAQMAKKVEAGELMLGHFSARYSELDELLQEAAEIFPDTILAEEGKMYRLTKSRDKMVLHVK